MYLLLTYRFFVTVMHVLPKGNINIETFIFEFPITVFIPKTTSIFECEDRLVGLLEKVIIRIML